MTIIGSEASQVCEISLSQSLSSQHISEVLVPHIRKILVDGVLDHLSLVSSVSLGVLSAQQDICHDSDDNNAAQANAAAHKASVIYWAWRGPKDNRTNHVSHTVSNKGRGTDSSFLCCRSVPAAPNSVSRVLTCVSSHVRCG